MPQEIFDPRTIMQSEEPLMVLCNELNNPIAETIDWRTDIPGVEPTDHAMLSRRQAKFVCQTMRVFNAYNEIWMDQYLKRGVSLAFIQLVNSNPDFVAAFNASVDARLNGPWWTKTYDYLGILGQAVGQPWIHTPGLRYCSVDVIRHLVNSCPKLPKTDQKVINNIPPESNPEVLRQIIVQNPSTFNIKFTYNSTTGIIVSS